MKNYLFRVEAVNLANTVYDTSDISTIRGGGFYLLHRVNELAKIASYKSHVVTEGASMAVFKIETDDPEKTRKDIIQSLYGENIKPFISEMMFLVEYLEYNGGNFPESMAQLLGKIRVSQMQAPSMRVFDHTLFGSKKGFDQFNRVLPACEDDDNKKKYMSIFTKRRRDTGVNLKRSIYARILEKSEAEVNLDFTNELDELSNDPKKGNLHHKIAFIYVDGNKFGSLQRNFDETQLKSYDTNLKRFKKNLLENIFALKNKYPSFLTEKNKLRLETLLWGGDEIKMIVPAWMGWTVAKVFFETAETLKIETEDGNKDLTFAMGLVFTHHKNPIQNLVKITHELAEVVKKNLNKSAVYNREGGNRLHYMVLESLETLPSDYSSFAINHYKTSVQKLSLSPGDMNDLQQFATCLDDGFPRNKIRSISQAWLTDITGRTKDQYPTAISKSLSMCEMEKDKKEELEKLIQAVTGFNTKQGLVAPSNIDKGYQWLQLAELYDYLVWKEDK